jgi:predicted membrane protein
METLIIIAILIVVAIAAGLLVVFYYLRKGFKIVKKMASGEMTDEEFERLSKKFHKAGGTTCKFDNDYFKGASTTQQQYQQQARQNARNGQGSQGGQSLKQERSSFKTKEGVTIVDERSSQNSKKIFAQDEGEYVEFTEEP